MLQDSNSLSNALDEPEIIAPSRLRPRLYAIGGIGLLLTALLLGGTLWSVKYALEESVIDATQAANASITQAFINENWRRVTTLLPNGLDWTAEQVRASPENREIDALVRTFSKGTDVLKIKIYDLEGKVQYATDPGQIGDNASANKYFQAALAGQAQSQLTFRGRFDGLEGHVFDRDLISSYIPAVVDDKVAGVVELYADRTFAINKARQALQALAIGLTPLYLGLYLLVMLLLIRNERLRDQKQTELRELALREEQANKAKTEFLAHMSHELRTPLNSILGHAQLMATESENLPAALDKRKEIQEHASRIMGSGWHLLGMIEEVLDLTKIESGKSQLDIAPVALAPVFQDCVNQLEAQAATARVHLGALDIDTAGEWVMADRSRLRQVLLNLISNAIKYNVPNGRIELQVRTGADNTVLIHVRDTGRGMSEEQLARLFQPFTRFVKRGETIQGSGVGLALSKRLVEEMNGSLMVQSKPGEGSVFTVSLPRIEKPEAQIEVDVNERQHVARDHDELEESSRISSGRDLRVLYIEDSFANLEVVRMFLARHPGFELLTAETGEAGLEMASSSQPDVILLDMHLPGIDGLEVKAKLAANAATANIPVIALSAGAMNFEIETALKAGFVEYLTKPLRLPRLLETLDRFSGPEFQPASGSPDPQAN